ncbi:receptor-type tyrosine-protein phosphatase mu-like isoform X2 [Mya arenaria]|uniref:receptor-type tyrosine-protein phosphatase mu-like isoform X2 n=1 Tax=Mya arenaria TaxID=6604 RepID=UPI0022E402E9|nr:receptor-type tyrosine-protein phosphatase mu-like isoform X2 [Mya arenaria]
MSKQWVYMYYIQRLCWLHRWVFSESLRLFTLSSILYIMRSTKCTSCTNGRFGHMCQYQCTEDCDNGNCDSSKASCLCNSNFAGEKCDQCVAWYFGNDCKQRCSEGCSISCNRFYGSCTCKAGWAGNRCDTCADNYFGYMCNGQCNSNCVTCTGEYNCQHCIAGRYGYNCQNRCGKGCINNSCDIHSGYCQCKSSNFVGSTSFLYCHECIPGQYGQTCELRCPHKCHNCDNEYNCSSCTIGYFGESCQIPCPDGCEGNTCKKEDGSCESCRRGYFGRNCSVSCPDSCLLCDQHGFCSECKPGYSNTREQCSCRTDICVNPLNCNACANTSYFEHNNECCLCNLDNCVSCATTADTVNCKMCKGGNFPNPNGQCETCSFQCVNTECDSSSGKCLQGCIHGYWNNTCDQKCDPECLSCKQTDGSCTHCKNNTKFGPYCRLECSTTCKHSVCGFDGHCTNGCMTNTYGKRCENTCNGYCITQNNRTVCSEETGMCLYGCQTGYNGSFCPQVMEVEAEKHPSSTAAIGGGIGGGIIALAVIVIVGLFLLRKRRVNLGKKSQPPEKELENLSALYATVNKGRASQVDYANDNTGNFHSVTIIENPTHQNRPPNAPGKETSHTLTENNLEIDEDDASAREIAVIFEESGGVYYNSAKEVSKFKLHVADLPEYVRNISLKDLEEEFQKIPYGLVKPFAVSQTKLNIHRNRYKGIYPYDDTRVVVRGGNSDYINASYIDGFGKRNAYIATLGPMAKQLGEFGQFWRMVWQQKVEKIVMLTNLVEGMKTKCEQYWPDYHQRQIYGEIEVVCKVKELYADFIWRQFALSKNSEERNLHHLQFTSWPDKDIPDDVTSVIEFRQRVNALPSTFDGPVVVHCSAGVGRTGTYIALDILTKEGETKRVIDIPGCVLNMRQNRPNMIQTLSQYKYLHQALVNTLTLDCLLIRRGNFSEYMEKSSKQDIHEQFEKMHLNHEQKSDSELQATERNRVMTKKNRKHADIPGDSDYINAIYINSLMTKHRFLVAQTPLPDTVSDFIALALQENCSCIVSMEAHMAKHKGIGLYFPGDNQTMTTDKVSVRSTTDQSANHFVKRILHFEPEGKTKKDVTVPHYEYLDWDTKHNVPKSVELFLAFIKEVEDVCKSSPLKGPILLHCLNGAGKSGLLCVVSTLLEQLSEDNEVSVVNVVQKVRAGRPLAIPNKEQFYFCYECVLHSVNATDNAVYYNIAGDIQRE